MPVLSERGQISSLPLKSENCAGVVDASPTPLLSRRAMAAVFIALTAISLIPLFVVDVVPLANMPNHMARIRILAEIGQDPALAANYRLNWALQPNLAIDLLLAPLAGFVPPLELGRWFTALCMLLLIGGTVAAYRALNGRVDFWPVAVFLFIYNHILIWGFLNFLFGLGIAIAGFAAWVATADRSGWKRALLFAVGGLAMFFVHLMALGIYGLLVSSWEIWRLREHWPDWKRLVREWAWGAVQFLPAALLLLMALPEEAREPEWLWGGAVQRLLSALAPLTTNRSAMDLIFVVALVPLAVILFVRRWVKPARGMTLPVIVLLAAALSVPFWTYGRFGGVWGLDARLWIAFAFVAAAGLRYTGPQRAGIAIGVLSVGLFGARIFQITEDWLTYDAQIAEYREAARIFTAGEHIFQAQDTKSPVAGDPASFQDFYYHITNFSVLDRSVFLPTLFTDSTKQPVVAAPPLRDMDTPVGRPLEPGELRAWADPAVFDWFDDDIQIGDQRYYGYMWQDRFDHVVFLEGEERIHPVPELLEPVASGSYFTIYRVLRYGCTGDYPNSCEAARDKGLRWDPTGETAVP